MEYSLAGRISVNTERDTCMVRDGTNSSTSVLMTAVNHQYFFLSWHQARALYIRSSTSQTPVKPRTILVNTSPSISEEWMLTVLLFSWQETKRAYVIFAFYTDKFSLHHSYSIYLQYPRISVCACLPCLTKTTKKKKGLHHRKKKHL